MAQASLGNDSTIDFGLGRRRRRRPAAPRPDVGARVRRLPPGQPGVRRRQQLVGAGAGGELSVEASGTVKLGCCCRSARRRMLDPIDNTLVDQERSGGRASASRSPRTTPTSAPTSARSASTSGTEADPRQLPRRLRRRRPPARPTARRRRSRDFFTRASTSESTTAGPTARRRREILCADFPVYVNGHAGRHDNLTVATTLGDGDDLLDVFGGASDRRSRLPDAASRRSSTASPFKFDSLAEGLKQYLFYAETSLRTASNNGEMPVIGKDLQAGADFMGDTRDEARRRSSRRTATRHGRPGAGRTCTTTSWPRSSASSSTARRRHPASTSPATASSQPPADSRRQPRSTATPAPTTRRSTSTRSSRSSRTPGRHHATSPWPSDPATAVTNDAAPERDQVQHRDLDQDRRRHRLQGPAGDAARRRPRPRRTRRRRR